MKLAAYLLLMMAVLLVGCGSQSSSQKPTIQAPKTAGAGSPNKPITDAAGDLPEPYRFLARNKNQFIGSGKDYWLYEIKALQGAPIVATQWASWCTSCAAEAPLLARAAEEYRGRVAFVGINALDTRDAAEGFLSGNYMGMPQIDDPDGEIIKEISDVGRSGLPRTTLISRFGVPVFTNIGSYSDYQSLQDDIERYLQPSVAAEKADKNKTR